jgi:hypothetical protein
MKMNKGQRQSHAALRAMQMVTMNHARVATCKYEQGGHMQV